MATFDAFALATAIGARTKRIALTVGPLAVGVRDPMAMAMGVASVAAVSGRSVNLAIGASSPVVVDAWPGRPWARTGGHLPQSAAARFAALVDLAGEGASPHELLDRVPRELCGAVGVVGSEDQLRRRAEESGAAGVDELAVVRATAADPGGRLTLEALSESA